MKQINILAAALLVIFIQNTTVMAAPSLSEIQKQDELIHKQQQNIAAKEAEILSEKRRQAEMLKLQKAKKSLKKLELPQEEIAFYINKIEVKGEGREKLPWVIEYLEQYQNQKIGIKGITLLNQVINEALIDKGYVTSKIYVGEQDLTKGQLKFTLIVGTIGEIRFKDPNTWGTLRNAFSVHRGDLLNIRDLEQGLEQMKRVPSQDVDMKIEPSKNKGQSDIVIDIKRIEPWRMVINIDDSGTEDTGKLQASTSIGIDNIFSMNDIFNISWNKDLERNGLEYGTKIASFYYSIPFGKQTLSYSHTQNDHHQTIKNAVNPFRSSGELSSDRFSITHLLRRDQTSKTNFEYNILMKKRRSYIDDTEIIVQRQDTTAMQLGLNHRQYIGNNVIDAAVYWQKGVAWFGAQPGPTDHIANQPTTLYDLYTFDLSLNTPMKLGSKIGQYSFTLRGQQTKDHIYSSDFFSIGGRYTVRGFDGEQTLSAENGWLIRNEIKMPINKYQQIYAAIDWGKVQGEATQYLVGRELLGTALGLRGQMDKAHYEVFVGWPIKKPEGFKTAKQAYGFQLVFEL